MNISRFEIVAIVDHNWGLSYKGKPPSSTEPMKSWNQYRNELTIGSHKNNCVILGRKTFLNLCEGKPLKDRRTYVVSRDLNQETYPNVTIYKSLLDCLIGIGNQLQKFNKVFILGGYSVFKKAIDDFLYLIDKIHVAQINNSLYDCDECFFPIDELKRRGVIPTIELKTQDYTRIVFEPKVKHQEELYLSLLDKLIDSSDKYIVDANETYACFNEKLIFDIEREIPIITSRQLEYKDIISDVIDHVKTKEFTKDSIGLSLRSFGSIYHGVDRYDTGFDQLAEAVEKLNNGQNYVMNFFEVPGAPEYAYIYTSSCKRYINISISFSKCEAYELLPYYMVYFTLLSKIIAFFSKKMSKYLNIYASQYTLESKFLEASKKITRRTPRPLCKFDLKNISQLRTFEDIERGNISLSDYTSWAKIILRN